VIPADRLAEERGRLRAVPIAPAAYALKIPVVVSARARVSYEGGDYSMPPDTIGQAATLHLYRDRLAIVTKAGAVVRHPQRIARGHASILPEHRAAMVEAVRGVRARLYYQRQSLWELGRAAEQWLTELVHRRPSAWRHDVEQCFAFLQDSGATALVDAFAWGVRHHAIGAEYVGAFLREGDDRQSLVNADVSPPAVNGGPPGGSQSHDRPGGRYLGIPLASAVEAGR